jgi:hypothetical protein
MRIIIVFLLLAFMTLPAKADKFVPQRLILVATSPDAKQAKVGIHRARLDQEVMLYAVALGKLDGKPVVVSKAPYLIIDGKKVKKIIKPEKLNTNLQLKWYKVQPTGYFYNNTWGGFHWSEINYQEFVWQEWGSSWSKKADAHPLAPYRDVNAGAGTMAYKVSLRAGDTVLSSPGKESLDRGGLSEKVIRIAFRADDSFIGYLGELFNTPYIWGSAGIPPKVHQAERLIGSDCADFVVYGARRMGKNLRYRSSWHLVEMARTIAAAVKVDAKGRFVDSQGKPLVIAKNKINVGDLLLFKGHVGALCEDRKPVGILDTNDIMIHTYWAPPAKEAISDTAYSNSAVKVLRWK